MRTACGHDRGPGQDGRRLLVLGSGLRGSGHETGALEGRPLPALRHNPGRDIGRRHRRRQPGHRGARPKQSL